MGTELSNRLYAVSNSQRDLEWEWNKFVEEQQRVSSKVKEITKILKQIKGEKDKKKREALRKKMHNAIISYNKLGTARYHAWNDFFLKAPPFEKAISELRKHIAHREKHSLFRNKQHTVDAKKTLQTALDRARYFNEYAKQNWKDIQNHHNKFSKLW